jgi:hypothetical protein
MRGIWKSAMIAVVAFLLGSTVGVALLGGTSFASTLVPSFFGIANEDGSRVAKVGPGGRFLVNAYLTNTSDLQGPPGPAGPTGSAGRSDHRVKRDPFATEYLESN